ncbi:MAG: stearoyl-CoA desaturase (delta-9 desaturase) [Gammaproteobacteria bacterium]|jgi:stearoyl-CoA desaturase (delta-9 desaturase)
MTGFVDLPWWGYLLYTLLATHLTIIGVTLYLHRSICHRALQMHPLVTHVLRFWLWLSTGMDTRQWVAVHRKHHAKVETDEDPHSPQIYGIKKVLLEGVELYRVEGNEQETIDKYGHGCPEDWLELKVYRGNSDKGYYVMMAINLLLFGPIGLTIWAIQMAWIPLFAAGGINGVGHYWGYRKFETADTSTNMVPWGTIIGGEELHNNHHAFASSAKFSVQWYEFDIGWMYICMMRAVGLAKVKKLPPRMVEIPGKGMPDADTLSAVLSNRFQVMGQFARTVLLQVHREEVSKLAGDERHLLARVKALLGRDESMLSEDAKARLDTALEQSDTLATVYQYKQSLKAIWQERSASQERLVQSLKEWCEEAEASGIASLQEFARRLPSFHLANAAT